MPGPTPDQVAHYVRLREELWDSTWNGLETFWWLVVQPDAARLTAAEVVRRLGGDLATTLPEPPVDAEWDEDLVFVEERDGAVVLVGFHPPDVLADPLLSLSRGATVHSVFWLVNNTNRLYVVVDGVLRAGLDVIRPDERSGADPGALTEHLGPLYELAGSGTPGPDWETALATVESLTGVRLDADWFRRPQQRATIPT